MVAAALMLAASSCATRSGSGGGARSRDETALKPVIAVMDFDDRASFHGNWNIGQGFAELLMADLMESDRFVVLERQHISDVMSEILRQGKDLFRAEGRVAPGRLKNAQYFISGMITDFTVTGDASGWFAASGLLARGRSSKARVAVIVKVHEVESGEVIASARTSGEVSAGGLGAQVKYKDISFGGDSYFRTPLGKATEKAISRAVRELLEGIPVQSWEPRVAESGPDYVVINGGRNVKLTVGDRFAVRGPGRDITDPVTGNIIEKVPGKVSGKIEVTKVNEMSAYAALLDGEARRGDYLEREARP
jgi:curli biogenesis system outer membrane secretion channel CsgG